MRFVEHYQKSLSNETIQWISAWVDPVGDEFKKIRLGMPNDNIVKELSQFKPSKTVLLYRGTGEYKNQLTSYTYDKDVAEGFSDTVIKSKVHPDSILVDFTLIPKEIEDIISVETEMFSPAKNDLKEVVVFSNKLSNEIK